MASSDTIYSSWKKSEMLLNETEHMVLLLATNNVSHGVPSTLPGVAFVSQG